MAMASSSTQFKGKILNPTTEAEQKEKKNLNLYLPLYKAALKGDWESAKSFFEHDPEALAAKISPTSETILHIAVGIKKSIYFVEKLLELIQPEALESLTDKAKNTALHFTAMFGNVEAAKLLVAKNPRLPNVGNHNGGVPLNMAAAYGHREMVSYLLTVTRDDVKPSPFEDADGIMLLNQVVVAELYDLALQLVQRYPTLAIMQSPAGHSALKRLVGKPHAFPSGSRLDIWQRFVYFCVPVKLDSFSNKPSGGYMENPTESSLKLAQTSIRVQFLRRNHFISALQKLHIVLWEVIERLVPHIKHIRDTKLMHHQSLQLLKCLCKEISGLDHTKATSIFGPPMLLAAEKGIHEVVEEILESCPSAVWSLNSKGQDIFKVAIMNRHENIFNLLYHMTERKQLITRLMDREGNSILHLAGKLAPPHRLNIVSGAALQMQRELQWYKEVEYFVLPDYKEWKNFKGEGPATIFTEQHKDLLKEGETWMKETAMSHTVTATLIATIAFAAAITVPGGNNGDNGLPIFSQEKAFIIFAVSNALSLFSSTASLLMFLSILTARYAEADFFSVLPKRVIIGLVSLFVSVTSMMMAFSAIVYLVLGYKRACILIPVAALASLPVTLFVSLQFPLLVGMIKSTYSPGIFGKKGERVLH